MIEGSNDNINWEIIDDQKNNSTQNGYNAIHTLKIENANDNKFKYL